MRMSLVKLVALAALFVGPCWGCGSSGGTPVTLIPVKGKVTYKGQPLTKGVVEFEPEGYGRPAKGQLQSDGTFELTTARAGDGVVAGAHRIFFSGFDKSLAKDRVLKKYESPNTSKLTAEVSPDNAEFTFDLK
jgi:hypothetical protein